MTIKGIKWRLEMGYRNLITIMRHPWIATIRVKGLLKLFELGFIYEKSLQTKIDAPILDIGSHLGLSACVLSEREAEREVFSFEWFKGLQNVEPVDGSFKNNDYVADKTQYLENIKGRPIKLFDGDAIQSIKDLDLNKFSFAYLDLDLYKPTKEILIMLDKIARPGNVIISHDALSNGIIMAFNELHSNKRIKIEKKWNFISIIYI